MKRITALTICLSLLCQQTGVCQTLDLSALFTPAAAHSAAVFRPPHLRYLQYGHAGDMFRLMVDKGDESPEGAGRMERAAEKLMDYFFTGVSLPDDVFWVNLRPDSPENMIDEALLDTDIGRILLEADVQLKKDVALATDPGTKEGKDYWDRIYKRAEELFGMNETMDIPTLSRPWIVPGEIIIRESESSAYVYKATLKVMLERDYLKGSADYAFRDERQRQLNEYSSRLLREMIIPRIDREVNSSPQYASLRQVYYSLVLAKWFKEKFAGEQTFKPVTGYANWSKESYFEAYKSSFERGEYNRTERVVSAGSGKMRSYSSGGIVLLPKVDAVSGDPVTSIPAFQNPPERPWLLPLVYRGGKAGREAREAERPAAIRKDGGIVTARLFNGIVSLRNRDDGEAARMRIHVSPAGAEDKKIVVISDLNGDENTRRETLGEAVRLGCREYFIDVLRQPRERVERFIAAILSPQTEVIPGQLADTIFLIREKGEIRNFAYLKKNGEVDLRAIDNQKVLLSRNRWLRRDIKVNDILSPDLYNNRFLLEQYTKALLSHYEEKRSAPGLFDFGQARSDGGRRTPVSVEALRKILSADDLKEAFIDSLEKNIVLGSGLNIKNWRICGPAAFALAWIISRRTGLPLGQGLEGDHLELKLDLWVPSDPGAIADSTEHVYLLAHIGEKTVYIDPVYNLQFGQGSREVLVREFERGQHEQALKEEYNIIGFDPAHSAAGFAPGFRYLETEDQIGRFHGEAVRVMHTIDAIHHFPYAEGLKKVLFEFLPDDGEMRAMIGEADRRADTEVEQAMEGWHENLAESRQFSGDSMFETNSFPEFGFYSVSMRGADPGFAFMMMEDESGVDVSVLDNYSQRQMSREELDWFVVRLEACQDPAVREIWSKISGSEGFEEFKAQMLRDGGKKKKDPVKAAVNAVRSAKLETGMSKEMLEVLKELERPSLSIFSGFPGISLNELRAVSLAEITRMYTRCGETARHDLAPAFAALAGQYLTQADSSIGGSKMASSARELLRTVSVDAAPLKDGGAVERTTLEDRLRTAINDNGILEFNSALEGNLSEEMTDIEIEKERFSLLYGIMRGYNRDLPIELSENSREANLSIVLNELVKNAHDSIIGYFDAEWRSFKGIRLPQGYEGKIGVETKTEGEDLVIIVNDNGMGEDAPDSAYKRNQQRYHGGQMLGLELVERFVRENNGSFGLKFDRSGGQAVLRVPLKNVRFKTGYRSQREADAPIREGVTKDGGAAREEVLKDLSGWVREAVSERSKYKRLGHGTIDLALCEAYLKELLLNASSVTVSPRVENPDYLLTVEPGISLEINPGFFNDRRADSRKFFPLLIHALRNYSGIDVRIKSGPFTLEVPAASIGTTHIRTKDDPDVYHAFGVPTPFDHPDGSLISMVDLLYPEKRERALEFYRKESGDEWSFRVFRSDTAFTIMMDRLKYVITGQKICFRRTALDVGRMFCDLLAGSISYGRVKALNNNDIPIPFVSYDPREKVEDDAAGTASGDLSRDGGERTVNSLRLLQHIAASVLPKGEEFDPGRTEHLLAVKAACGKYLAPEKKKQLRGTLAMDLNYIERILSFVFDPSAEQKIVIYEIFSNDYGLSQLDREEVSLRCQRKGLEWNKENLFDFNTLVFLGLTEVDIVPRSRLHVLIKADKERFRVLYRDIDSYKDITVFAKKKTVKSVVEDMLFEEMVKNSVSAYDKEAISEILGNIRRSDVVIDGKLATASALSSAKNDFNRMSDVERENVEQRLGIYRASRETSRGTTPVAQMDGGGSEKGGVDLRRLPLARQPLENISAPIEADNARIKDLDGEIERLKSMAEKGLSPSIGRLRDVVIFCRRNGVLAIHRGELLACVTDILRWEEGQARRSDPGMKEILNMIES